MVLRRMFQQLFLGKRRRLPRYRNPLQYIVSDRNRRYRRRPAPHYRALTSVGSRCFRDHTSLTDITTTAKYYNVSDIDIGDTPMDRTTDKIYARNFMFKGLLNWDNAGTPNVSIRFILCWGAPALDPSGWSTISDIYGRTTNATNVYHVLYDKTIVNTEIDATRNYRRIFINIPLGGKMIKYLATAGETTNMCNRALFFVVVGDAANGTSDITSVSRYFSFKE